jgi:hypothetical protein
VPTTPIELREEGKEAEVGGVEVRGERSQLALEVVEGGGGSGRGGGGGEHGWMILNISSDIKRTRLVFSIDRTA